MKETQQREFVHFLEYTDAQPDILPVKKGFILNPFNHVQFQQLA